MYIVHKLPFKYFLGLGCHLGTRFHLWSVETSPNVLFKTSKYPIINLTSTSLNFIVSIKFIKFCTSRNLKPLFFFAQGSEPYLVKTDNIWRFAYYIVQYWLPGIISNFKFVYKKDKFKSIPSIFLSIRRYPDFLIFLGTNPSTQCLASAESRSARMPSIGLNDTDSGPAMFNYSIFSNSKSFVAAFHFYKLFATAVIDGANFFTIGIGHKLFTFYMKNFSLSKIAPQITRGYPFPFPTKNWKHKKFGSFNYALQHWPFQKLFSTYAPGLNSFLAQFSYSVMIAGSSTPGFFRKLRYFRASHSIKIIEFPSFHFKIFRRLINFIKAPHFGAFSSKTRSYFLSRYVPFTKLVYKQHKIFKKIFINRKLKRRKSNVRRRIIKFHRPNQYTKTYVLSRIKKKLIFYDGFNDNVPKK